MHWKQGLLRDLERSASARPLPLAVVVSEAAASPGADAASEIGLDQEVVAFLDEQVHPV